MRSASCLSFGDLADIDRKVGLRELGKETLVVVLVGKVRVSAIVTWQRVAADLQRGEIVTTVVVVVFNCETSMLEYNNLSASLALVPSYSFLFLCIGWVSDCDAAGRLSL